MDLPQLAPCFCWKTKLQSMMQQNKSTKHKRRVADPFPATREGQFVAQGWSRARGSLVSNAWGRHNNKGASKWPNRQTLVCRVGALATEGLREKTPQPTNRLSTDSWTMTNNDSPICGGSSAAQPHVNQQVLLLASLLVVLTGEEDDSILDNLRSDSNNNQEFLHVESMEDLK